MCDVSGAPACLGRAAELCLQRRWAEGLGVPGHGAPGGTDSPTALGETLLSLLGCTEVRKYSARKGMLLI